MSSAPLMAPQPPAAAQVPAPVVAPPQIIEGYAAPAPVLTPAPVLAPVSAPPAMPIEEASSEPGTMTTPVMAPLAPAREYVPAPLAPLPSSVMETTTAPPPIAPNAGPDKVVLGFANNVPLSVALRQVLPTDYAYSVAQDVSLGTLVSWRGGANWREVLKNMLLPAGLAAKEEGLLVEIVPAATPSLGTLPGASVASVTELKPFEAARASQPAVEGGEIALSSGGKPMPLAPLPAPTGAPETKYPSMGYLKAPTGAAPQPLAASVIAPPVSLTDSAPQAPQGEAFDVWTVQRGETLRDALEKWAARAHVDLSWQSEYDYPLQANVSFSGSFEDAVRSLLTGLQDAKPQPIGKLHKNEEAGQTVLIIQARGNNYNN